MVLHLADPNFRRSNRAADQPQPTQRHCSAAHSWAELERVGANRAASRESERRGRYRHGVAGRDDLAGIDRDPAGIGGNQHDVPRRQVIVLAIANDPEPVMVTPLLPLMVPATVNGVPLFNANDPRSR